jgi:signal transduction histidine kinase
VYRIASVTYDVTDQVRARRELEVARADADDARRAAEAANAVKAQFLATMSHELRTPLNAIGGYAQLIEMGVRGPVTPAQQEDLARIQQSQQHLLGLINSVLNYAKLEAGRVAYEVAEVPLAAAVAAVEALVSPQMRAKGLAFAVPACDPAIAALADAGKLRQIVLNLLSNATKFTPSGGRITVTCGADGAGQVFVRVADTGVGIAPEQLDTVFDPFVQVGRRLTTPAEGVGLGLAISRDLARGMGGDLTAESTPGVGSTFTLTLPAAP